MLTPFHGLISVLLPPSPQVTYNTTISIHNYFRSYGMALGLGHAPAPIKLVMGIVEIREHLGGGSGVQLGQGA